MMSATLSAIFMFIKITFKDLKTQTKLKVLEIMYQNAMYIVISWYNKNCWLLVKNADVSRTEGVSHVDLL